MNSGLVFVSVIDKEFWEMARMLTDSIIVGNFAAY